MKTLHHENAVVWRILRKEKIVILKTDFEMVCVTLKLSDLTKIKS